MTMTQGRPLMNWQKMVKHACVGLGLLGVLWGRAPVWAMGARPVEAPVRRDQKPASSLADMEAAAGHVLFLGPRIVFQTPKGDVVIVTFPKEAPKTVKRVLELVRGGFYDELAFHRIVPGFVVQVGDPQTRQLAIDDARVGRGGSGVRVEPEFEGQSLRHLVGTLGLARDRDPGSADSQFYVTMQESPHLDEVYTIWGQVLDGMDVVRQLSVGDRILKTRILAPSDSPAVTEPTP